MLTVDLRSGRLRLYLHVLLTGLIVLAGWIWFGNAGAALLVLWGKASCPRRQPMTLSIPLAEVCELWLYSMALVVRQWNGQLIWIFRDELPAADYARVRRELKAQIEGLL